jgi:hypothetical protein
MKEKAMNINGNSGGQTETDGAEKVIRFACGACFGFGFAFSFFWIFDDLQSLFITFTISLAVAFVFGILALRYGDYFWERISDWLWWWN